MKCIVITLIVSIATLILGLYFGWKYIGAGEVAATLTVMQKKTIPSKIFCKFFLSVSRLYQIIPRNILSIQPLGIGFYSQGH